MKILITGGSGFLGKVLLKKLSSLKINIVCLTQSKIEQNSPRNKEIRFIKADIMSLTSLDRVKNEFKNIDQIVHLAGLVPKNYFDDIPEKMFNVNVYGTLNILKTFGTHIKSFIYISTAEIYGITNNFGAINEKQPVNPLTHYATSKFSAERVCEIYLKDSNTILTILRLATLYGPNDTISRAIPNFIRTALAGKSLKVYGGKQLRDYLHVEDAAQAIIYAIFNPQAGIFNIGSSKAKCIKDVAEIIINKINPKLKVKILPIKDNDGNFLLDINKAKEILHFKPKFSFPDGLEEEIEWIKENR